MKLSLNFVKDYIELDDNIEVQDLAEKMTKAGSEYDSAEKLVNATKLIIGEIKECEMHPDSDHLHLCKVDIGNEILDIVCGAPNARKGIKVIVAQVGAELPEDFKIKKGMIRGQESNGMLCALYEIGIDKKFLSEADKNGIHELPQDAPVGEDPIKYMGLDDSVVDFELTANRGDLLSILGMAYELGAIYDKTVKPVEIDYKEVGEDINKEFSVDVDTDSCKLFLAKKAKNVIIKESPNFIKNRLIASGIRPINNVVDISNYVMLELGQPLHFYDADSLGRKIVVRQAEDGEKLTTLDNIERILNQNDIVITDGKKTIGLAGVMGGLDTEVEETTTNVIIESAIFDSVKVRMTSNKILRSEASNRFEKGLDPARTYMAIDRACTLLQKYADAEIVTGIAKYDVTENMRIVHIDKTIRKIKSKMSNMGLNETLSYVLINDKDVHKFTNDSFEELRLLDPITEERNTLRYSIIPSLYKIYKYNKARENKDVCLFEIGKGFWKKSEIYGENQKICVLMSGEYYTGVGHNKNVDFYDIKGVTEELLNYLGYENRYSFIMPKQIPTEFHPGQTAEISVNNDIVGIIGKIHPAVEKDSVFVMEINLDKLLEKRLKL